MLAQNFQSPAALGITDEEQDALVRVLGMLERSELVHFRESGEHRFDLSRAWDHNDCGTVGCIAGWAHFISQGKAFPHAQNSFWYRTIGNDNLKELFMPENIGYDKFRSITPAQAALALRSYLTTGEPRWDEALTA